MTKIPDERDGDSRFSLAINLYDIQRVDPFIRSMMKLGEKLNKDPSEIIRVDENRPDERGVVFVCDLLSAALLCDIIREHDKKSSEDPTRVYLRKGKGVWRKLASSEVLTVTRKNNGQVDGNSSDSLAVLNPKIFKSQKSSKLERAGPSPSPPKFGKIETLDDALFE